MKEKLLDLTSRNIDIGQVAQEKLVEVGGGGRLAELLLSTLQKDYLFA